MYQWQHFLNVRIDVLKRPKPTQVRRLSNQQNNSIEPIHLSTFHLMDSF